MNLNRTIDRKRNQRIQATLGASLVPVETRSRRTMYRVDRGQAQLGFVEKLPDDRHTTHPWKAFRGLGVRAEFVGAFYVADGGLDRAVQEVLK